jgi:hypothetical protein
VHIQTGFAATGISEADSFGLSRKYIQTNRFISQAPASHRFEVAQPNPEGMQAVSRGSSAAKNHGILSMD